MMFPNFLVIIPLFFLLKNMSLLDTKTGLVLVYVAYSLSFTICVLSGFFQSLPGELEEAAMIDGCGYGQTFWKVMLPLARPGLVVVEKVAEGGHDGIQDGLQLFADARDCENTGRQILSLAETGGTDLVDHRPRSDPIVFPWLPRSTSRPG